MDARGPMEARVLGVERGCNAMERDLAALKRQLVGLSQGIWDAWSDVATPETVSTCSASYSGTFIGCKGTGIVGATIKVVDHATRALLGTVTTTSGGAFSGTVTITAGSENVDFTVATFADSNFTLSCGSNTVGTLTPAAAAGFVKENGFSDYPINQTLTVVDSLYGSFTATYSGTFSGTLGWQTTGVTVNYTGHGACGAVTGVPIQYRLQQNSSGVWASAIQLTHVNAGTLCPQSSGGVGNNFAHAITGSVTYPLPPATFAGNFHNNAAQTIYLSATTSTYTINWTG